MLRTRKEELLCWYKDCLGSSACAKVLGLLGRQQAGHKPAACPDSREVTFIFPTAPQCHSPRSGCISHKSGPSIQDTIWHVSNIYQYLLIFLHSELLLVWSYSWLKKKSPKPLSAQKEERWIKRKRRWGAIQPFSLALLLYHQAWPLMNDSSLNIHETRKGQHLAAGWSNFQGFFSHNLDSKMLRNKEIYDCSWYQSIT